MELNPTASEATHFLGLADGETEPKPMSQYAQRGRLGV